MESDANYCAACSPLGFPFGEPGCACAICSAPLQLSAEQVAMTRAIRNRIALARLRRPVPEMRPEQQILRPYRPRGKGWKQWEVSTALKQQAYVIERWYNRAHEVQVLSAIEVSTEHAGVIPATPHYHLSISKLVHLAPRPQRCSSAKARWVLEEFGMEGALEDNHVPSGIVRNFWRPVAEPNVGKVCPCVDSEPAIREDRGDYVWRPAP